MRGASASSKNPTFGAWGMTGAPFQKFKLRR